MILNSMEALISFIQNESFLNGIFVAMIIFVVLCHRFPEFVARQQSNPYTIQLHWNFGVESFNFQLLNYEIYHVSAVCRWSHHLTIILEAFLWSIVIRWACGLLLSLTILSVLIFQSFSFGDRKFGFAMASIWLSLSLFSEFILQTSSNIDIFNLKMLIVLSVIIRTLSHVLELVPPLVNGDQDKFSEEIALWFAFSDPWASTKAWILGNLSEMASALPGRLFPVVVYLILCNFGFQSTQLQSIPEATQLSSQILKSGWSSYHLTSELYSWARKPSVQNAPHA